MIVDIGSSQNSSISHGVPHLYVETLPVSMNAGNVIKSETPTQPGQAVVGYVMWADGGTHSIRKVAHKFATVTDGTGSTLRVSLQNVASDSTFGYPDGTPDQSVSTTTLPTTGEWTEYTLSADRANVASGTLLAVAFELSVVGSGTSIAMTLPSYLTAGGLGHRVTYTAAWGSPSTALPIGFTASDGTVGWFAGLSVISAINSHAYNSSSDPKAYGNKFTFPYAVEISAIGAQCIAGADFTAEVRAADGATVLASRDVVANTTASKSAARVYNLPVTPVTVASNTSFYIDILPTTETNVTVYSYDVPTAAFMPSLPLGTYGAYTTLAANDTWAAETATRRLFAWPVITAVDSGGAASVGTTAFNIGTEGVVG